MITNSRLYSGGKPVTEKEKPLRSALRREVNLEDVERDGWSEKGLAVLRAREYNEVNDVPITKVELESCGAVVYYSGDDIMEKVTPEKGRSETSSPGEIQVWS